MGVTRLTAWDEILRQMGCDNVRAHHLAEQASFLVGKSRKSTIYHCINFDAPDTLSLKLFIQPYRDRLRRTIMNSVRKSVAHRFVLLFDALECAFNFNDDTPRTL